MTPEPTTAVVVGTGMIGRVHAAAIRGCGAILRGVVASTPTRSTEVAAQWDAGIGYPDLASALADDAVDAVHICTPNSLHVSQTLQAMGAGKHVICEKPLATSVDDALALQAVSATAGRVLAVPFVYRYHPLVREIKARAEQGQFGPWQLIHGSYLQDWMLNPNASNWRVDPARGGPSRAFADIGSHWCDLVEWVAGVRFAEVVAGTAITQPSRPASQVSSFGQPAGPSEAGTRAMTTEDAATVLMRTAEGVLGSVTVSQVSAGRKNRLWFELDGTEGSAVFDQENPESVWLGGERGSQIIVRDPNVGDPEQRRLSVLPAGHPQGYADCFRAFVADAYSAMAGQQVHGLPTAGDGVRSARLVEAVLRSAATRAWTRVEDDHPCPEAQEG